MNAWLIAIAVYVIINIVVALVYVYDKAKAVANEWRVSERTLIILAAFGPFGAFLGMKGAHHKTNKPKFRIVKVFLGFHVIIIACLLVLFL